MKIKKITAIIVITSILMLCLGALLFAFHDCHHTSESCFVCELFKEQAEKTLYGACVVTFAALFAICFYLCLQRERSKGRDNTPVGLKVKLTR